MPPFFQNELKLDSTFPERAKARQYFLPRAMKAGLRYSMQIGDT